MEANLIETATKIKEKQEFLRINRRTIGRKTRRNINREIGQLVEEYNKTVGFKALKW